MNSYLTEAAVIRLAAVLMDEQAALDHFQYACAGALRRYRGLQTRAVRQTEGIDDMPLKAEALAFGQRCGRFMNICSLATDLDTQAAVIRGMFFDRDVPLEKEAVSRMLHALLLRAQMKLHTTKPGYEDIHRWLRDFDALAAGLPDFVDALSAAVCDESRKAEYLALFDRDDPIIRQALEGRALTPGQTLPAGRCAVGRCLAAICRKPDFSRPLLKRAYRPSPDFDGRKKADPAVLERICREPVLGHVDCDRPLIIERIEMRLCGKQCLLIVDTKAGIRGVSIAGVNWQYFYPILQKKIAPYFIGKDARDTERLFEEIYVLDLNYKIQGLAYWCCVAWLEASLLDILGKAKGVSLGELFGPRVNERVSYYCASGNRGTSPQEELEILLERITEVGAKAVKFKIGGRMSWDRDSMGQRSEELIVLARKYFGDDMVIHADSNGSFGPEKAIGYGHMLEDINAYFYEEPCRFDYLWETEEVARALTIPIAFGEQETSLRRFRYLIEHDAVGVVQPDIQYFGGFIRTTRVARMAEAAGIPITLHISGGIQYANVLHLASFTPNMGRYQELKDGYLETRGFFTDPLCLKDGSINIPRGTGLCMAFDEGFLRAGERVFLVE